MIIENNRQNISELSTKILAGVNKALRQLVENSATKNESLVVGDDNGGFKTVPAKELLKTLSKQEK